VKTVFLSLLVTFSVQALAQNAIPYKPIELVKQDPTRGNRDEWDQTGQFCYKERGTSAVKCATIVQLGEVKVRDKGNWSQDPADQFYISKLSRTAQDVASKYSKLYIRYIGLEDGRRFVAQTFYGSETIFAFGSVAVGGVTGAVAAKIDSFSYSPGDSSLKKPKSPDASGMVLDAAIKEDPSSNFVIGAIKTVGADLIVAEEIATIHLNTNPQPAIPTNPLPSLR
jgi:hypothetical protein